MDISRILSGLNPSRSNKRRESPENVLHREPTHRLSSSSPHDRKNQPQPKFSVKLLLPQAHSRTYYDISSPYAPHDPQLRAPHNCQNSAPPRRTTPRKLYSEAKKYHYGTLFVCELSDLSEVFCFSSIAWRRVVQT